MCLLSSLIQSISIREIWEETWALLRSWVDTEMLHADHTCNYEWQYVGDDVLFNKWFCTPIEDDKIQGRTIGWKVKQSKQGQKTKH